MILPNKQSFKRKELQNLQIILLIIHLFISDF